MSQSSPAQPPSDRKSRRSQRRDKDKDHEDDELKLPPRWEKVQGAVWLIGLAILFATDNFFPGILVLVALSGLVQAGLSWYVNRQQAQQELETVREVHLPENCPSCGGPITPATVTWQGKQTARCPFCGSSIKATQPTTPPTAP